MTSATTASREAPASPTVVLTRRDVRRLLGMGECIDAVEDAFGRHAEGRTIAPGVLGEHVDSGGYWVTSTPARRWFLGRKHIAPGAFVAAAARVYRSAIDAGSGIALNLGGRGE